MTDHSTSKSTRKGDRAQLNAGAAVIRNAEAATKAQAAAKEAARLKTATVGKPSWRDFYDVHKAAEFYHGFSSNEQLQELTEDIDQRQLIFGRIHTASVLGKTFVIDGISRLDGIEKTGRQIVDEKGNWIGALEGHVVHHAGKTDEAVWEIVNSLNLKRRHLSTSQRALIATELATMTAGGDRKSDHSRKTANDSISQSKAAKLLKVSTDSVKQARKVLREAPEKAEAIKAGKVTVGKAVSELPSKPRRAASPKKAQTLQERVEHKLNVFMKMKDWRIEDRHEVQLALIGCLLGLYAFDKGTDKFIEPVSVTYPDNAGTHKIADVLAGRVRIGKTTTKGGK